MRKTKEDLIMNNNKYFADNMNAVSTKVGNYTKQNIGTK